jgi:hypothetical protein
MALLFEVRALQLQTKGDFQGALDQLETLLGLSRQLRSHAPVLPALVGRAAELSAFNILMRWLPAVGPRPALLKQALDLIQDHAARRPSSADLVKAECLLLQNSVASSPRLREPFSWVQALDTGKTSVNAWVWTAATHVPWEQERQERLIRAFCQGRVRGPQPSLSQGEDTFARVARENGLPPSAGPGAALSASKWGELLIESRLLEAHPAFAWSPEQEQVRLRGYILVTALSLYQAEKGKPPEKLEDLVPAYLLALPIDPYTGQPFHYRISAGEKIAWGFSERFGEDLTFTLVKGQGLVWSDGDRSFKSPEGNLSAAAYLFPVPVWKDR